MNLLIWGGAAVFAIGFMIAPWMMFVGLAMFATGALALVWSLIGP